MRAKFQFIDYFPSFEIVTNPKFVTRNYEKNLRNVQQSSVNTVMEIFHSSYVKSGAQFNENNSSNMIDEVGDIDCEEALLEQFENVPFSYSSDQDILLFGNSHLGFFRNALSKETINRSIFIPINFLKNDPIGDIENFRFQNFYFKNQKFRDVSSHKCSFLVLVGYGFLGDGIIRAFGQLKAGFEGCIGQDISPSLPPIMIDKGDVRTLFQRQLKVRIQHLRKISAERLFERIICIASPDMPEKVARFRLGDSFVDSGIFPKYKHIYMEELQKLADQLDHTVSFIFHNNKNLYSEAGFVKDIYAGPLKWDIHPHRQFYIDSNVEEKLIALISSRSE